MTSQTDFRAGLLDPRTPVPVGLLDGSDGGAGKRYDVYRNNVTHSLIEALKTAFPFVIRLIGDEPFTRLAVTYARSHPPASPLMMFYGDTFPDFLLEVVNPKSAALLADAARVDLAMRRSYHAADAPALTPQHLQEISPEALEAAHFRKAPATFIVQSDGPLFDLWTGTQPGPAAQDVLITRVEFDPAAHLLPKGAATWLTALESGAGFEAAHTHTLETCPDFDLAQTLTLSLQAAALTTPDDKDLK